MSTARNCCHDRLDGSRCGAVALTRKSYCHFHQELEDRKRRRLAMIERLGGTDNTHLDLPAIEDRASAMIALNEVLQALAFGLIDRITARTYFAGIRIGLSTIKNTALLPDFMEPESEADSAPSMCEAFLARLAELPMPNPDDPLPIPLMNACAETETSLTDVILSEGGLPSVLSSLGNPSRRTPMNCTNLHSSTLDFDSGSSFAKS